MKKYVIMQLKDMLSEIIPSDNIIVLESGKIIATGRHCDLEKSCNAYRGLLGLPQIKAAVYEGEGEIYG